MNDDVDTLMIEVRASTGGFRADVEAMRGSLDTSLLSGFARAGDVLERGLLSAIRRGKLGFDELKTMALSTMQEIAAQALQAGLGQLFGRPGAGGGNTGAGNLIGSLVGSLLGLPGRATGGPVSPGAAYLVGERGPELFVPTSAGRVETGSTLSNRLGNQGREVRVAINLAAPRGSQAPVMLRRSSRQVASAVARAMRDY